MDWLAQTVAEFGGFTQITASALLAVVVIMILRGDLVPRRRLEEARQDRDAWHTAHDVKQEALTEHEKNNAETTRSLDLVQRALDAMTPPREGGQRGTSGPVPSP